MINANISAVLNVLGLIVVPRWEKADEDGWVTNRTRKPGRL